MTNYLNFLLPDFRNKSGRKWPLWILCRSSHPSCVLPFNLWYSGSKGYNSRTGRLGSLTYFVPLGCHSKRSESLMSSFLLLWKRVKIFERIPPFRECDEILSPFHTSCSSRGWRWDVSIRWWVIHILWVSVREPVKAWDGGERKSVMIITINLRPLSKMRDTIALVGQQGWRMHCVACCTCKPVWLSFTIKPDDGCIWNVWESTCKWFIMNAE